MDCQYSFKREAKVYIVYQGLQYLMDISEISFSQTYTEHTYSFKTLQNNKLFEGSVINKANPANFTIRFPGLRESDLRVLFDLSVNVDTFDIYIETLQDVFKLEYSVITTTNFVFERTLPLTLEVNGEASKLERIESTIPGTPVARSSTRTYNKISDLSITLDGKDLSELNTSVSMTLENMVSWIPWTSVDGAIQAEVDNSAMFPLQFTVDKRSISGSFTQYLVEDFLTWNTNVPINIKVGEFSGTFYGFELDAQNCSFKTNPNTNEIFTQTYEWRLTQNPANLSDILVYHVI